MKSPDTHCAPGLELKELTEKSPEPSADDLPGEFGRRRAERDV